MANTSPCSTGRRPCSGAARRCSKPSRRPRPTPVGRCTCTCWRRSTSATGPTKRIPAASCASSTSIGLLTPRLTLAHCAWARPDELALIAERGATIAVNTSSNLGLKSRHRAAARDAAAGLPRGDGPRRHGLRRGRRRAARSAAGLCAAPRLGLRHDHDAGAAVGASRSRGRIAPGAPADIVLLDWDALDDDALFPDIDPLDLLLARGNGRHIADGVHRRAHGGRRRPRAGRRRAGAAGRIAGRACAPRWPPMPAMRDWRGTVQALAEDLAPFYRQGHFGGCCG